MKYKMPGIEAERKKGVRGRFELKNKKTVRILCAALAGALAIAGLTLTVLADRGLLSGYHPLKTPEAGQIRVACVGDSSKR